MKVIVLLDNGQTRSLPVKWHPSWKSSNSFYNVIHQAGLYMTSSTINEITDGIKERNQKRRESSIPHSFESEFSLSNIVSAEAPFEILIDTEDNMPWRHCGTTVREIPYGEGIDWNKIVIA